MKISVIGAGGVGGYFGGKLAYAGNDVTFVARGKHYQALKNNGLKVKSTLGDFSVTPVNIVDNINKIDNPGLVIIAVKAWQVKDIAKELKPWMNKNTVIMPLQNGVTAFGEITEIIDKQNVIGGLCRILSQIESPGVINHFGITPTVIIGEMNNEKTDRVKKIKEIFSKSDIKVKIADDILSELWKKFIGICTSALLAVCRSTYGEVRELRETRKLMVELITEIFVLSQKIGINIESDYVEKSMSFVDSFPYDSTSSLTRDVWDGKPSEIEHQNGTVVRLGKLYGVDTPVNRFVYDCILPMEKRARSIRN